MILYTLAPSGNSQKVRVALRLLDVPFEERTLSGGAHKRDPFTSLNPLGQVPVLEDGDVVLRDSQAILVYLAARHAPGDWDGRTPAERGRIAQWLSLASNEIANGPSQLRRAALFGATIERAPAEALTARALDLVEAKLETAEWLEGERLTVADLACAPYFALASQGGIDLEPYRRIRAWTARIASLPRFPAMDGWAPRSLQPSQERSL